MMQEAPNQYVELKQIPKGVDRKIDQSPRNQEVPPETYKQLQGLERVFGRLPIYPSEGVELSSLESWGITQKMEDLRNDFSRIQRKMSDIENYYLNARWDLMNNLGLWISNIPEIAQKIRKNDDSSVSSTMFGERTFYV